MHLDMPSNAWLSILTYPATQAPKIQEGVCLQHSGVCGEVWDHGTGVLVVEVGEAEAGERGVGREKPALRLVVHVVSGNHFRSRKYII